MRSPKPALVLLGALGQPETFVPIQTLLAEQRRHRASAAQSAAGTVALVATHELNRLNEPAARDGSTRRVNRPHGPARIGGARAGVPTLLAPMKAPPS